MCTYLDCNMRGKGNQHEYLTSSSLNHDRLSAVRMNQYSLAPPFMMLMLLIVSQPLRITCTTAKGKEFRWQDSQDHHNGIVERTCLWKIDRSINHVNMCKAGHTVRVDFPDEYNSESEKQLILEEKQDFWKCAQIMQSAGQ